MPLFVSTPPSVSGVFAQSVPPPATLQPTGTGNSIAVGNFPWGPSEKLTYPGSMQAFWQTYAPAGMVRTGSAHLTTIRKGWPSLGAVRVEGPTAASATATISNSVPTQIFTLTGLFPGTSGNSIIATTAAADDGNANHFNLTVSVSSASGTTSEIYRNLNISGVGADVLPNTTASVLFTFAKLASGIPVLGSTTFSGGTDGTITSTQYVGTPGGNDAGFALLESDDTIDFVFTDDPGNTIRTSVNTGLFAHSVLMTDRIGCIQGPAAQTPSAAQTDVANYRSINCVYVDPWIQIFDDTTGAQQNVPGGCWAASIMAQLPPSVSPAWKADFVKGMFAGVAAAEANRGAFRGQNTASGIMTLIPAHKGGFVFERGVNTSLTAGQTNVTRTRMGIYIARSAVNSWFPYVDAPNVPFFQQSLMDSIQVFLQTLQNNQKINPAVLPYILNFAVLPASATNTAATLANGDFTVGSQIQIGSNMSRIFLNMQYGESVIVTAA